MLLISNNLLRYMPLPEGAVIRINLAWARNLDYLKEILRELNSDVFIDLPVGRTKPPNTKFNFEELKSIINKYDNIKYFAVSNVESEKDLSAYLKDLGEAVNIIPKIESKVGILNIKQITDVLGKEKIIMLDHDDLYADLIRNDIPSSKFFNYITKLTDFCEANSVKILKTRGVIFSDEDKYYY